MCLPLLLPPRNDGAQERVSSLQCPARTPTTKESPQNRPTTRFPARHSTVPRCSGAGAARVAAINAEGEQLPRLMLAGKRRLYFCPGRSSKYIALISQVVEKGLPSIVDPLVRRVYQYSLTSPTKGSTALLVPLYSTHACACRRFVLTMPKRV